MLFFWRGEEARTSRLTASLDPGTQGLSCVNVRHAMVRGKLAPWGGPWEDP